MSIALISDLHLQESRPSMTLGFLQYLENLQADALYILGDFFEYWIGDDYHSDFNLQIMQALAKKTQAGMRIYFMHGNRDFAIGKDFAEFTGVEIIVENHILKIADKFFVLAHGDALCSDDKAYLLYRKFIRNPIFMRLMLKTRLAFRVKLADNLRKKSKASKQKKSMQIMDVSQDTVIDLLEQTQADGLIHGHTHRPNMHKVQLKNALAFRLVLGDWQDNLGYEARINAKGKIEQTSFSF